MKYNLAADLCLGVLLVLATSVHAHEEAQPLQHCAGDRGVMSAAPIVNVEALAAQLNLSTQQINKIRDIINDINTPLVAMREKLQDYSAMLQKLQAAQPVDTSAVHAIGAKQARLFEDMLQLRSNTQSAIYAVLTPEQLQQLRAAHHTEPAP